MTLETWLAFFAASWLISLSPGAGAISCMAAGMRYGYARAFWNIVGLQIGILFVLAIVALGLGAIIAASTTLFTAIKWLGAAYLVWLGIQQWRAPASPVREESGADTTQGAPRQLVLRGFLVNATNPKGIVFMLAVLPQFIDPHAPQLPQYALCGATLFFTDLVVMSGYTGLAAKVLRMLREPHHVRWVNRTFGGLFVAAGAVLATFRRA
ncbi:Homoserine/homoserine lactone efflux protein [Burkholderiales bacterium]|nr:Homoserine/homoserine lactone efflux protein [Burkholderiales bacterium]